MGRWDLQGDRENADREEDVLHTFDLDSDSDKDDEFAECFSRYV